MPPNAQFSCHGQAANHRELARPWQEKCVTRYAEYTKRRLGLQLAMKQPAAAVCQQRQRRQAVAVVAVVASSSSSGSGSGSGAASSGSGSGSKQRQRQRAAAADQATSRLQSRISHRGTQCIDPKCAPQVSHATLLQLSPMPSGIPGNRSIPNRNSPIQSLLVINTPPPNAPVPAALPVIVSPQRMMLVDEPPSW